MMNYLEKEKEKERILLIGDLNCDPDSESIEYLKQKQKVVDLESVYPLDKKDCYSTFKFRDQELKRMIDYLFYQENSFKVLKRI